VIFYPADFTFICPTELEEAADYYEEFKKLGVKDSKQLTPKRRAFLADLIREKAEDFEVIVVYPDEIESSNAEGVNLNDVEAIACADIINKMNKGKGKMKVVLDCPSTGIKKWNDLLKTKIKNLSNLEISCEHKADENHIAVSAASILAKCVREEEMQKLREKYGDEIGSGYTSDPSTQQFLKKHAKKYNDDGIFRKSWATWKNANNSLNQKTL